MKRMFVPTLLVFAAALAAVAVAATPEGKIGPSLHITGNGRALAPVGALTQVGNFPTGAALTPDGRHIWVVDSGYGRNDVRVLDTASGAIVQTLPLPGSYGAVAFTPDGKTAYVSGLPRGDDTVGTSRTDGGNVLHVFDVDPVTGTGTERDPIALPAAPSTNQGSGGTTVSSSIAVSPDGKTVGVALLSQNQVALIDRASGAVRSVDVGAYPTGVVFDRRGRLWVSNASDGTLSVIDPAAGSVSATVSGLGGALGDNNSQPEGLAADPRRDLVYVAVSQRDTVAVVDTEQDKIIKTVSVSRPGSPLGTEPTALALTPDGRTLYVTDAGEDALAAISLVARSRNDSRAARSYLDRPSIAAVARWLRASTRENRRYRGLKHHSARAKLKHIRRLRALNAILAGRASIACGGPTAAQLARYRALVTRALQGPRTHRAAALRSALLVAPRRSICRPGDDQIPGLPAYQLIGKIPTAAYPTAVLVTPDGGRVIWVSGKGMGAGPNPGYSFYGKSPYGTYVFEMLLGAVGRIAQPGDRAIRAMTPAALAQARPADAPDAAPVGTIVRSGGPIKHVFLIVKENRTYDQVFGTTAGADGDPSLELFDDNGVKGPTGGVTPNAHALARRFGLLDHVYADSEVSADGHIITATSEANDYVQKVVPQSYGGRGVSYSNTSSMMLPASISVFNQAEKDGVTFRNYGELAVTGGAATADTANYPGVLAGSAVPVAANGPVCEPTPACIQDSLLTSGSPNGAVSRAESFINAFDAQDATGQVPGFSYLVLPNDHTVGATPNAPTPKAMVADNDLGLGQIVDAISHSSVWPSSAIFVVEDDTQDGADHIDAHRMPAFVISPYSRGGVTTGRYDQYSALRTAEMLVGIQPLSTNDALARPLYEAFIPAGAKPNIAPYSAIAPQQPINQKNPSSGSAADLSAALPFDRLDAVPQVISDRILWASVFGDSRPAPLPGPGASSQEFERALGALRVLASGGDARAWLTGNRDDAGAVGHLPGLTADVHRRAAAVAQSYLQNLQDHR